MSTAPYSTRAVAKSGTQPPAEHHLTMAMTDAERAEFREMFNFSRRDGPIVPPLNAGANDRTNAAADTRDRDELKYMMDLLRLNASEAELTRMMTEVDTDGSGDVDFDEFVAIMSRTVPFPVPATTLRASLAMFEDEQNKGCCSTDMLRQALFYHCASSMADGGAEIEHLLSCVDPTNTGTINIEDFMKMITHAEQVTAAAAVGRRSP